LNPIIIKFAISAAPVEVVYNYLTTENEFDPEKESYIEITLNSNSLYSATTVQNKI
jgi:hypothetical protein